MPDYKIKFLKNLAIEIVDDPAGGGETLEEFLARSEDPLAINNVGNKFSDIGEYESAIICYQRAVELSRNYSFEIRYSIEQNLRSVADALSEKLKQQAADRFPFPNQGCE